MTWVPILLAFKIDKYFVNTSCVNCVPGPFWWKPWRSVLPRSLSNAAVWCYGFVTKCYFRYWAAPSIMLPDYSPLHAMNLNVLLGRKPFLNNNLNASKTVINPPPSSLAPVCDPVSQVSICPPARTIWFFKFVSVPVISNTKFDEFRSFHSLFNSKVILIYWFLYCIRANISASSTVIAAQGICFSGYGSLYSIYPAWTEYMLEDATERTNIPIAPYLTAIEAPSTRYLTDYP